MTIVSPATFYRWVRDGSNGKPKPKNPKGGQRKPKELRELVLKIAEETGFGLTRIVGELRKLGIKKISRAEGRVEYHTAGALGKGERIWMLAKLPGHIRVRGSEDITEKYLLLSNAHDGTAALRVFFTPVRVVCSNTLSMAHRRGEGKGISIMHKGDLGAKVREAQKVLGLAARFYDDVQIKADALAGYFPTKRQLGYYFRELVPNPAEGSRTRARNVRKRLWELFEQGKGQDIQDIRYSAWAAYNAVTEFTDHHRPTRAKTESERASRRLYSQWFGSGARLKARAWDLALAMASDN